MIGVVSIPSSPIGCMLKKVDVVICTKNRYGLLPATVSQVRTLLPCNNLFIIDSSQYPDFSFVSSLGVQVGFTPDALLGLARQTGLKAASTDVVAFIDDDITLDSAWFPRMWFALHSDSKALAVSSRVVFGYQTDQTIEKLHGCNARSEGASIGIALLKRKEILSLGGFNINVHRGEDAELELRLKSYGYKWLRCREAIAYHKLTFKEFMQKAIDNVQSWLLIWKYSKHRNRFIVERFGSAFAMPFYYGFLTRDVKVGVYYGLFKFRTLLHFLMVDKK